MRFQHPIARFAGLDACDLLLAETVELLLPLGITPPMGRFGKRRIPHRMEVGRAGEHTDGPLVAAAVAQPSRVHRAVHVADQVNQHLEREGLLLGCEVAAFELRDKRGDGFQHVAVRILGHRFECPALVYIQIVPRFGVGIFGRVAGVVEPVGVVDGRMAAQRLVDFLGRLGRQMAFGNIGRDVVAFLPPRQHALRRKQAADEQQQFLHDRSV